MGYFEDSGFSVLINEPYAGCMIPIDYYRKDKRVQGIMIEINKRLYLDHGLEKSKDFDEVQGCIFQMLGKIQKFTK